MNINHLRYFAKLARSQSYAQAAEELHISSPSLLYAIKALEIEVEVPLIVSSHKGSSLTEYGRRYLVFVDNALDALETGKAEIQAMSKGKQPIRISAVGPMCNIQIPWLIQRFEESPQGEKAAISIKFVSSFDAIDSVRSGSADIAFVGLENDTDLDELEYYSCSYDRIFLIVPQVHPLASQRVVTFRDILNCDFVGFSDNTGVKHVIARRFFEECGEYPKPIAESEYSFQVAGMVGAGMGVALCPEDPVFKTARVKVKQVQNKPWKRMMGMIYREDYKNRVVVRDFIAFVKKWIPEPIPVSDYPDQYIKL